VPPGPPNRQDYYPPETGLILWANSRDPSSVSVERCFVIASSILVTHHGCCRLLTHQHQPCAGQGKATPQCRLGFRFVNTRNLGFNRPGLGNDGSGRSAGLGSLGRILNVSEMWSSMSIRHRRDAVGPGLQSPGELLGRPRFQVALVSQLPLSVSCPCQSACRILSGPTIVIPTSGSSRREKPDSRPGVGGTRAPLQTNR
jgi:hypothetical protein